jgi:hypothetical protein
MNMTKTDRDKISLWDYVTKSDRYAIADSEDMEVFVRVCDLVLRNGWVAQGGLVTTITNSSCWYTQAFIRKDARELRDKIVEEFK